MSDSHHFHRYQTLRSPHIGVADVTFEPQTSIEKHTKVFDSIGSGECLTA